LINTIRAALAADTAEIAIIAGATDLFPPEMTAEIIAPMLSGAADLWLVSQSERINGFAFASPERMTDGTWNLLALAVDPAVQGQGIGSALIGRVEVALRGQGARMLLIETLGTPAFEAVRALYLQRGYTQEAVIRDYYMPGGDKVVFRKLF
jgi:ribosomal protein S18 acetylase RimI-like enzyme